MSIEIMTWVFRHSESTGNERLVLLALADHADDDTWSCWPAVKTIARKARISERTTQRALASLAQCGRVTVFQDGGGRGNTAHYQINKGCQVDTLSPAERVTTPAERVTDQVEKGCQIVQKSDRFLSEPSLEPSEEPSGISAGKFSAQGSARNFLERQYRHLGLRVRISDGLVRMFEGAETAVGVEALRGAAVKALQECAEMGKSPGSALFELCKTMHGEHKPTRKSRKQQIDEEARDSLAAGALEYIEARRRRA